MARTFSDLHTESGLKARRVPLRKSLYFWLSHSPRASLAFSGSPSRFAPTGHHPPNFSTLSISRTSYIALPLQPQAVHLHLEMPNFPVHGIRSLCVLNISDASQQKQLHFCKYHVASSNTSSFSPILIIDAEESTWMNPQQFISSFTAEGMPQLHFRKYPHGREVKGAMLDVLLSLLGMKCGSCKGVRSSLRISQLDWPIPNPYDDVLSTPNVPHRLVLSQRAPAVVNKG